MMNNDTYHLNELHSVLLELLTVFDYICRKNDIKYSIGFGTMLGAIRHKGFIPWDDDVDVLILRKDFNKLCRIIDNDLKQEYFFQTSQTDKKYPYNTARLRKNNTSMIYEKWIDAGFHQGIYIDIIPLDNVPDNFFRALIQKFLIVLLTPFRFFKNKKVFFSGGRNIPFFLKWLLYSIFHKFPLNRISELETRVETFYLNESCSKVAFLGEGNLFLKRWYPVQPIMKSYLENIIDVSFENTNLMCSKSYDQLLRQWYGDYMILPPENKRKIYHQPYFFSSNIDYAEYIRDR